jgi:hypothetical protein
MAQYTIVLTAELKSLMAERGLKRLNNEAKNLKRNMGEANKALGGGAFAIRGIATELRGIAQGLTIAITALAGGMALVGRQSINMAAEFENLKVTMEVLSGSVEEADRLIRDLKEFAATTPLSLRDVEQGATTLVALGESTDDVIPKLRLLGQAAVALNRPLDQLIRVRQQLAGGVVLARSLQAVGLTREELQAEVGRDLGEASGAELVAGFESALTQFTGLFDRTLNTIRGRLVNLQDIWELALAALATPLSPLIQEIAVNIADGFERIKDFLEDNADEVADAFQIIVDAARDFLRPVTNAFNVFFSNLEDRPQLLSDLANGFVMVSKALGGLVIGTTVLSGITGLLAAFTLLRISLPHLAATIIALLAPLRSLVVAQGLATGIASAQVTQTGILASTISQTAFQFRVFAQIAGRAIAPLTLLIGVFRNLGAIRGAIDGITGAFSGLIGALDGLISLIPGIKGFGDLFNRIFSGLDLLIISFLGGIELAFRELGLGFLRVQAFLQGFTDPREFKAYRDAADELNSALERMEDSTFDAIDGILGLRNPFERSGDAAEDSTEKLISFADALNNIDTDGLIRELNSLIKAFAGLSVASRQAIIDQALARGLIVPISTEGELTPDQEAFPFDLGPVAQQLESEGFDLAEIFKPLVDAGERLDQEYIEDILGLDDLLGTGGGGGGSASENLSDFQQSLKDLNDTVRELAIEEQLALELGEDVTDIYESRADALRDAFIEMSAIADLTEEEKIIVQGIRAELDRVLAELQAVEIQQIVNEFNQMASILDTQVAILEALNIDTRSLVESQKSNALDTILNLAEVVSETGVNAEIWGDINTALGEYLDAVDTLGEMDIQDVIDEFNQQQARTDIERGLEDQSDLLPRPVSGDLSEAFENVIRDIQETFKADPNLRVEGHPLIELRDDLLEVMQLEVQRRQENVDALIDHIAELQALGVPLEELTPLFNDLTDASHALYNAQTDLADAEELGDIFDPKDRPDRPSPWERQLKWKQAGLDFKGILENVWEEGGEILGDAIKEALSGGSVDISNVMMSLADTWATDVGDKLFSPVLGKIPGQKEPGLISGFGGFLGLAGPGLFTGITTGLIGMLFNEAFGDKPLEIEGPVDVNLVDIQSNAANFFSFGGFEGFTFTSRFKNVFESSLY